MPHHRHLDYAKLREIILEFGNLRGDGCPWDSGFLPVARKHEVGVRRRIIKRNTCRRPAGPSERYFLPFEVSPRRCLKAECVRRGECKPPHSKIASAALISTRSIRACSMANSTTETKNSASKGIRFT